MAKSVISLKRFNSCNRYHCNQLPCYNIPSPPLPPQITNLFASSSFYRNKILYQTMKVQGSIFSYTKGIALSAFDCKVKFSTSGWQNKIKNVNCFVSVPFFVILLLLSPDKMFLLVILGIAFNSIFQFFELRKIEFFQSVLFLFLRTCTLLIAW